jgi:tRNA pseudouridine38-40 synthase
MSTAAENMRTALTIEYDGAGYCGFQRQTRENSVQTELEKALSVVMRTPTHVFCAGRTDTGVNALGQVVHFSGVYPKPLDRIIYGLNSLLPKDIAVRHGAPVAPDFHARFSCVRREYVYIVHNTTYRPSTLGYKSLWIREPLDWSLAREALPHLKGEKDFAAFTKPALVKRGEITIRRIDEIDIIEKGPYAYIYIRGSGFLHNMIRIMVGTLIDVARKEIRPDAMAKIVASADRLAAGVTLRPHALYFLFAEYPGYDQSSVQNPLRAELLQSVT